MYSFKNIGDSFKIDDQILTYAGSLGELMNSATRLFWGYTADHWNPTSILTITTLFQLLNLGTVY